MLTPGQIELRLHGIGSSDIGAILGVDPHRAPNDTYLDKIGLGEPREETTETWCGSRAENFIASLYEERTGGGLIRLGYPNAGPGPTHEHRDEPWAMATPDRWRVDGSGLVEIKLVGAHMLYLWRAGVKLANGYWTGLPAHVDAQVRWQLEVCDQSRVDVAALLGGTDFRIYPVERDRAKGAELIENGRRFWEDHVLARVPPPHDAEAERRMLNLRYPMALGDMLPATAEAIEIRACLARVHAEQRLLNQDRLELENRAKALTTNADGVEGCWTWSRAGKVALWRSAVRALLVEQWDQLAAQMGEDERAWEAVARGLGAERLADEERGARRRFTVTKTKEERHGERERGAGALSRAAADGSEENFPGALQAPGGPVSDEW